MSGHEDRGVKETMSTCYRGANNIDSQNQCASGVSRLAKAFAGHLREMRVSIASHPELAARLKIRVVPTPLIFEGWMSVELIVGIVPEPYIFEMVRKAFGGVTEIQQAGETHPSGQWLRKRRRRVSLLSLTRPVAQLLSVNRFSTRV